MQSSKAYFPMEVTELGIVTEVNEAQPLKTSYLMKVTELGIATDAKEVQSLKA